MIERLPIAGCGFLLAVLWFDLMFDSLALAAGRGPIDEETLSAIAAYYARVTTEAYPMGRVVGLVMIATLTAIAVQLWQGGLPRRPLALSFALVLLPVSLAVFEIVPNAVRLGARTDPIEVQTGLARSIAWKHVACLLAIAAALVLQLWAGSRAPSVRTRPTPGSPDRPPQPTGTGGATSGSSTL